MKQLLLANWQLKQRDHTRSLAEDFDSSNDWIAATVPGTVHQALLETDHIPDPFWGLNEQAVQWIGEQAWLYRCEFELTQADLQAGVMLCCDGLDTIATMFVNGVHVLDSTNMFIGYRIPVAEYMHVGRNRLEIVFESALHYGHNQAELYGNRAVWNGDSSRVYVRKAQYHYGWDWGPCLLTAGPWLPVYLELGTVRIAEIACPYTLSDDLQRAVLPLTIALDVPDYAGLQVELTLLDPYGQVIFETTVAAAAQLVQTIALDQPLLWWPHGYGEQPRYTVNVQVYEQASGALQSEKTLRLGLRRVRLIQEPLDEESGSTFLFEINNTPIFCGGANWIPADSFLPRIDEQTYRQRIEQACALNFVMLRVWGGGIYETDTFYEVCDELGMLVWQDFMFACGIYPAHPEFQASVQAEAEYQIRRLRHYASLVIWCGNNEDYQIAQSLGVYDAAVNDDFLETDFPAREIYEHLLPRVCADLDPTRPYWPGSAYGGADPQDQTVGDRHTWEVWHGPMAPYQHYAKYEGRFVSEFGMQAAAAPQTLAAYIEPDERRPQSRTMEHHNKADDGPRRLAAYLQENIEVAEGWDAYIYATQFIQAEALAEAYRSWRRRWSGPGRYAVAGALVWQLNDCWPVTSWAISDYHGRLKPAAFAIRRELAPWSVGLAQNTHGIAIWATNATTQQQSAQIRIFVYDLEGLLIHSEIYAGLLHPNQSTELGRLLEPVHSDYVYAAQLLFDEQIVARTSLWPQPFKYYTLPEPELQLTWLAENQLRIATKRLVKGLWLSANDNVFWSDNMLDVFPHDPQIITVQGLQTNTLSIQCLRYQMPLQISPE